ncbi:MULTISPECIES: IS1634 family transposase [Micrococcales]|jgi:hypothetical protein|uniref:IS1634 family transposase n=1 Tax=Micrococcales TaxID=85006 RepID=UPI000A1E099D|nr:MULTISPECIES: IS1634 family transposase [Micrococcales]MCM1014483.1 IS1634 family transposase [Brevibacterium sp. XM4083]OSP09726.1 IS1634 family transposase [Microbacterium sp. LEMMJ01]
MSPFIRKVKTASGATAVQLARRVDGRDKIIKHLGSAHTDQELAVLLEIARQRLDPGQGEFDLDLAPETPPDQGSSGSRADGAVVAGHASRLLWDCLQQAYRACGFARIKDDAFEQLVLARIVEPTSKTGTGRVLDDLGITPVHLSTIKRCLARIQQRDYRDTASEACFEYAAAAGGLALVLYDVTTLYFEAEYEDELRKVGFSKERRVDPQIVVGLLVDQYGYPLEIGCFEGNHAETRTIVPILRQFQERHELDDIVVVADAGMLSNKNLLDLEDAGYKFIVGSRSAKAPLDLAERFTRRGDAFTDGEITETITTLGQQRTKWRAVYQWSRKRFVRDNQTLNQQRNRALAQIAGEKPVHKARFVKTNGGKKSFDEASYERAQQVAGLKGYVTNMSIERLDGAGVIAAYHDLWHVEQSFRMSKSDLCARPIFAHTRDSIEAHLTVVFCALAVARHIQTVTGVSIKKFVQLLRPLREVTVNINGHELLAKPEIPAEVAEILGAFKTH